MKEKVNKLLEVYIIIEINIREFKYSDIIGDKRFISSLIDRFFFFIFVR